MQVYAVAYDNPIPGYGTKTVGNLRLFDCQPAQEFKLESFNQGKYSEVNCCCPDTSAALACACTQGWTGQANPMGKSHKDSLVLAWPEAAPGLPWQFAL